MIYARAKLRKAVVGKHVVACAGLKTINPKYFAIGDFCYFGPNCRIEAWDHYNQDTFKPKIVFGKEVRINSSCHIGAIDKIVIDDKCLLGSNVMIIDHSHGRNSYDELKTHPTNRDLYSKGEVVVGKYCWICENVVILPGVHIGDGCVIGANSVVTKDIPKNSVAAGNPARVIKEIKR